MVLAVFFAPIFFLICPFGTGSGEAASSDSVEITTRAWPTKTTVGGEIRLFASVEHAGGFSIEPPPLKTSLAPFEIKKIQKLAPLERGGVTRDRFVFYLTAFEIGDFPIPPVAMRFTDRFGNPGVAQTQPVPVKIVSVGKKPTDKDDIRPIKGPVSTDTDFLRSFFLGLCAFFLTLFLIVKIILRRKNRSFFDSESLKPAHERAALELGRLKKKNYLSQGKHKEFYSEFSDILRRYLERRFQIETLELTTVEAVRVLKVKEFDADVVDGVKTILENADLVKFAKYLPPDGLENQLETALTALIDKTKPAEEVSAQIKEKPAQKK
jgi:hypothetical protein